MSDNINKPNREVIKKKMIRSEELIDKLVADLHFHNYLFVNEGDDIFTDRNRFVENVENALSCWGLDEKLNAHTDFFHGGNVISQSKIDYIYDYIDDVYIDYFFRTHKFHPIIIPQGFCDELFTKTGIVHPDKYTEVVLDLNNIYDRCTFVDLILRLFGLKDSKLYELFPNNHFLNGLQLTNRKFCFVIKNEYPYGNELQIYIDEKYKLNSKFRPILRAKEIVSFNQFYETNKYYFDYEGLTQAWINNYWQKIRDYISIKDNHIFGEYCIEDILMLYALLIDKFILSEENLITFLSPLLDVERDKSILNEFKKFENSHTDYKEIEPFIHSKDLYLRFTSRKRSRAFKFERQDDLFETIQLFEQNPIRSLVYNNPMPLPYLYNSLKLY